VTVVGSDRREVVLGVDSLDGCVGTSLGWCYPLCGDKSSISKANLNIEQFSLKS
jgi:hypothetical protein